MVTIVRTVVSIGILMIEIPTADSIAVIMDITTTQEKDKAVCHTKDNKIKKHPRFGDVFLHTSILQEVYTVLKENLLFGYKYQVPRSLWDHLYSVQYYRISFLSILPHL